MIRVALLSLVLLSPVSGAMARQDALSGPAGEPAPSELAQPMVVTSDTDAYCAILSRQIDEHARPLPQRVASLRDQGQHLCAVGQVRGGINRLRRALMALHGPDDDDAVDEPDGETRR